MKRTIWFRFVCVAGLFLSQGCSDNTQNPTASSSEAKPPGEAYTLDPSQVDFVEVVDNPYFPLLPGTKWVYDIKEGDKVVERDTVEVLNEKRAVHGTQATVVRDMVSVGDKLVEDTYDWYAQDEKGNVWYIGEMVDNYVGGIVVNHSGSWEWGVDGALPGVMMWADPAAHIGEEYFQEYLPGTAEDKGQVLSVNENVTVPFGSFETVVKTFDFSALETNAKEHKFYALNIGLIKEMDLNGREEVVLISFTSPTK